jgi:hypothetical protein
MRRILTRHQAGGRRCCISNSIRISELLLPNGLRTAIRQAGGARATPADLSKARSCVKGTAKSGVETTVSARIHGSS